MTFLIFVGYLAEQEGMYWVVPDSECAVGALRT